MTYEDDESPDDTLCPHCGDHVDPDSPYCCGEVGHVITRAEMDAEEKAREEARSAR